MCIYGNLHLKTRTKPCCKILWIFWQYVHMYLYSKKKSKHARLNNCPSRLQENFRTLSSYLVTIPGIICGTKTGTFLLLAWKKCRILSIAVASRRKSNSYAIYSGIKQKYMRKYVRTIICAEVTPSLHNFNDDRCSNQII